jgi:hypothetical protein
MLSININKLRNEVENRETKKIKIFENILEMCYNKILNTNKQNDDYSCTFIVPTVVFGLPLYNIGDCVVFIMDKLVEKGFEIYFALPTTIHISWKPESYKNKQLDYYDQSQNQLQNQLQNQIIKYNNISYNKNINQKQLNYQNKKDTNNIQYRSINEYKETSNSIYDLDDLDIFQNKVDKLF